jgi:hypothetical protein
MLRTYNDSFTKDLFADENLGRNEGPDARKGTGDGSGVHGHEEIRVRIACTVPQTGGGGVIAKVIGNGDHGNACGLCVGVEGFKI